MLGSDGLVEHVVQALFPGAEVPRHIALGVEAILDVEAVDQVVLVVGLKTKLCFCFAGLRVLGGYHEPLVVEFPVLSLTSVEVEQVVILVAVTPLEDLQNLLDLLV